MVVDAPSIITTHIGEIIRRNIAKYLLMMTQKIF
jgi:flagellar biosynthesis component FlhA